MGRRKRRWRRGGRGGHTGPAADRRGSHQSRRPVAEDVSRPVQRQHSRRRRRVRHQRGGHRALGHYREGAESARLSAIGRQGQGQGGGLCHRPLLHRRGVPDAAAGRGAGIRRGGFQGNEDEGGRPADGRRREARRRAAGSDRAGREAHGGRQPGLQRHERDTNGKQAGGIWMSSGSRSRSTRRT